MNATSSHAVIGVDTGGTFTDLIYRDDTRLLTYKLLSTPDDPGRAVLEGIRVLIQQCAELTESSPSTLPPRVVHGSTVATNALLENTQAKPAFLATKGFTDLIRLGRQHREDLYALEPKPRPALIPREHCLPISERLDEQGQVLQALDPESITTTIQQLRDLKIQSLAICLVHSYANPDHEQQLAAAIRDALPDIHLTVSSELLPEFREYERASTCLINAAVAPKMNDYLGRLEKELGASRLRIMASNGGAQPVSRIRKEPVQTILSGPAGGVLGALAAARSAGMKNFITLDMGGTSTDVALCKDEIAYSQVSEAAGLPVRLPCIDIHTVGAGGGSIAWKDSGGALRVGPRSAGANPGPVCYGKQSPPYQLTVTDANVFLHHLPQSTKLAGHLDLDLESLQAAFEQYAQDFPDDNSVSLASGILRIAEATMARAVQQISVSRGHDPRDFTLIPFGGAGALHACSLADSLGMTQVLIPHHPGLLSALGMCDAGAIYDLSQSVFLNIPLESSNSILQEIHTRLHPIINKLKDQAKSMAKEDQLTGLHEEIISLDLRFQGQSFELNLPLEPFDTLPQRFESLHEQRYGYIIQDRSIEIINARLRYRQLTETRSLILDVPQTTRPESTSVDSPIKIIPRQELQAGDQHIGPFCLTETHATTWVPEHWTLTCLPDRQLLLTREEIH